MTDEQLRSVGEAATLLGTTPRTLRYYEARGILEPAVVDGNGHRLYDSEALRNARQVLRLRSLGLSIASIQVIRRPEAIGDFRHILADQEARVAAQVHQLKAIHRRLTDLLGRLDGDPQLSPRTEQDTLNILEEITMLRIDQVYTRGGDEGTTSLIDGTRARKDDPSLEAAGDIDELVCALGFALSLDDQHRRELRELQNQIFDLPVTEPSRIDELVHSLEDQCDAISTSLEPLGSWVLPGGDPYPAALHLARATCRRAERRCWTADESLSAKYLNRLSDLLFLLARQAAGSREETWAPPTARA